MDLAGNGCIDGIIMQKHGLHAAEIVVDAHHPPAQEAPLILQHAGAEIEPQHLPGQCGRRSHDGHEQKYYALQQRYLQIVADDGQHQAGCKDQQSRSRLLSVQSRRLIPPALCSLYARVEDALIACGRPTLFREHTNL